MSTRRKFIRDASLIGMTPFLMQGLYGCKVDQSTVSKALDKGFTLDKFGIQLWTVRDFMEKDPKATLKSLGEYGYEQIESFQGGQGVFWGMTPKDYGKFLDDHGMSCISAHCDSQYALDLTKEDEFKKLVDDSASIGIQHLINPYLAFLKTNDEFKRATEGFNRLGEITKASGLKYAYHNHNYSFQDLDGGFPQDIMMSGTDADLVDFEMDVYWVVTAGQDPITWLKKYPNRFVLSHIKDRYDDAKVAELAKTEEPNGDMGIAASCVLGKGKIDFDAFFIEAEKQGMKKYIVEQERFDAGSSLECARKDAVFMQNYQA